MWKNILYSLALILGLLGLVGCVVAIVGTWNVNGRANRVIENLFGAVDHSLAAVQQRAGQIRDRVQALKITTSDIEEGLKNRAKTVSRERVNSRLGVKEKAEQIASGLQHADHWLDLTESSVQLVQKTLEVVVSTGVPVQMESVSRLLEELASLRVQLAQATERVERIREGTAEADENSLSEEASSRILSLTPRVIATLSSIDSRIANVEGRLSEIHFKAQNAEVESKRWIRIIAIGITLLIGWMAAAQGALSFLGWTGLRQRQTRFSAFDK